MSKTEVIEKMRKDGYPYKIKGNGGYNATLYDMQPLSGGEYMAIYRYPGGEYMAIYRYPGSVCCHILDEISSCFEIIEK